MAKKPLKAPILPTGSFIESLGKTYLIEILSEPIQRQYLDFKGLFDKPVSSKKLTFEFDEIADKYSDGDAYAIRSFCNQYRSGKSYQTPSIGRMFWVWLAALWAKNTPHWYLKTDAPLCPFWQMMHADESSQKHKGQNYFRSYWVKHHWVASNGQWEASGPLVSTIRWDAQPMQTFNKVG